MFSKKLFKSFKKNSSLIFFFITLIYFFYTYVSLFLFVFKNALFCLFLSISVFYICFHFIVRALTYPGSLFIYFHKTNYDNRIELCKFYMKESLKLSLIISDIRANVKEIIQKENKTNINQKIKLEELFSDYNNKDKYFNFFSSLYIFYTLYISYYLYVNLEEQTDFSDEQLNFYYYLKFFMIKINEIKIYINKDDIIYPDTFTEIRIHKDFNELVNEFIINRNPSYGKTWEDNIKKDCNSNSPFPKWIFGLQKYLFNKNRNGSNVEEETTAFLAEKRDDEENNDNDNNNSNNNNFIGSKSYSCIPHSSHYKEKEDLSSCREDKKQNKSINDIKSKDHNTKFNYDIVNNIPSNYVDVNILSLFYHENYEKSVTHVNYKKFFMVMNCHQFLKLLDDLMFFLNKLGDLFKINTLKEKMEITKFLRFINNFTKNHIAGTMDLFKYELIYKYYGKQQYLYVNKAKIDCMFIPCKKFLHDKMQKYMDLKKSGKKCIFSNENTSKNSSVFLNAFNNEFYNYMYDNEYLYDIPVVLYFNPNGAYYELNACYSGTLNFYLVNNINVFVYNYRGYSKSSGYPNLNKNNLDALKIAEFLLSKKVKHLGLHGTSIGGPLCSYVSYHLCNFNKTKNNTEFMDKLFKNENHIKITYKQINKTVRLMSRKKDKILNILLIPVKYVILLLQFIILFKLKIYNFRMKKKINSYNAQRRELRNSNDHLEKPWISFVCIDKSFYNIEEVAKYMVGEYAYNVLQFTSYKLDITKYYMNSNVPKIVIYDNEDEIIHYMSMVITGVSKEISKLYKNSKLYMNLQKGEFNSGEHNKWSDENMDDLYPLVMNNDKCYKDNTMKKWNIVVKLLRDNITDKGSDYDYTCDEMSSENKKSVVISKEKPIFIDTLIIDEYIDSSWFDNKLNNIDFRLFLQSWKVLNDCILFLNKSSTTNNSFISIGLETYKSIMSLYNSKENELEKETHNAIYCIYNDNMSFMNNFKKANSNYDDFIMIGCTNSDEVFKKANIYDMLKENEEFKLEMEKLNKVLRDIYMSKRKEVQKVHFTYSGFFLKDDYLYDYINTESRNNKDQPAFNIEDIDIINFLNQFSDSISKMVNALNYNLNACGQLFKELNKIPENEKVSFLKSFISRMKVFGSYPSQCFVSSNKKEFCNSFYQIPIILSNYCEDDVLNNMGDVNDDMSVSSKQKEEIYESLNSDTDTEDNEIILIHSHKEKRRSKNKRKPTKDDFEMVNNSIYDCNTSTPYITIKKSLLLHDLIICLNYFKNDNGLKEFLIFYKLDESTYILDIKQLILLLKTNSDNTSGGICFKSNNFLDIFSNDMGIDTNNVHFPGELEKYVSWMRLNNRMSICKIYLSLKNEINKMKNYAENLISEYRTINQNTNIHFTIFLIYRILIFKKILTHTYIIYTFMQRLNNSLDINLNKNEKDQNIDLKSLEPISSFNIYYKDSYKIYAPKVLGCPLMVNCGHNGTLNKEDLNFFNICLNFFLKQNT
ncbi:conserved Plasmodium protein, unknown function [Plasmodium malariae]|uniref:Alpha/beta hydrolase n=1 Tax=Plasmodium malariae TaxID=5858 RepID=A0A1D3SQT9_PLAMA|nr:conserved Plasmodium protein, unknown function [Plasmodium malariae]SCO93989.1 conserved Plasmodium protein, unknown function [Plasmodium malariae]